MNTLVSVIIPNKNCLTYLPTALESIWAQDIANIEVVFIDDGSTDASWQWICDQTKAHENIVAVKLDGVGCSTARNHAARIANGKYLAFLDADDYWYKHKLSAQLKLMEDNPQMGLCFTNYDHVTEEDELIVDCFSYWPKFNALISEDEGESHIIADAAATIFAENVVGTSTALVRRDLYLSVDGFDHNIKSASDWDLWMKLALKSQVGCIKAPLAGYLMRADSMTCNRVARLKAIENIITRYQEQITPHAVNAAYARLDEGYGEYYRENGKSLKALNADIKSVLKQPEKRRIKNILMDFKMLFTTQDVVTNTNLKSGN